MNHFLSYGPENTPAKGNHDPGLSLGLPWEPLTVLKERESQKKMENPHDSCKEGAMCRRGRQTI